LTTQPQSDAPLPQPPLLEQVEALRRAGRYQEALALTDESVLASAADPALLNAVADCARQVGLADQAEALWQRALALRPDYAEAAYLLGVLLHQRGSEAEAEACYRRALASRPGHADARHNLGFLCHRQQRYGEAEACYRRALALAPSKPDFHNKLGALLRELERYPEAEACYRRALDLWPEFAGAHYNLGLLLRNRSRFEEAEACFRRALALEPDDADARFALGILLLLLGRLKEGWPYCEARYHPGKKLERVALPDWPFPRWEGQPLAGKSLLILPEQGFGDEIQCCRYAAVLKQRGAARITLMCKAPLKALFLGLAGIDAVFAAEEAAAVPPHDYWTLALSIPCGLGTDQDSIPNRLPYLAAPPERVARWAPRLPAGNRRVGLAWKGSALHKNDAHRSLPNLEALAPLWRVPGLCFVSLQKGAGEDQAAAPPPGQPLLNLGPELRDFADTAAVLTALDLVICVDTAIAHLAGALNRPCWVLLPACGTDWRWQLERADSPWYPGALRLFRQPAEGGWAALVEAVAQELGRWSRNPPQASAGRPEQPAPGGARGSRIGGKAELPAPQPGAAPSALREQVVSLCRARRYREALALADGSALARTADPVLLNTVAVCARRVGLTDKAEALWRQALDLEPGYADARGNLGLLLKELGRLDEAAACYRQALALAPDQADTHRKLGNLLYELRRLDEAEACYRKALALAPDDAIACFKLGNVLYELQRLGEAEDCYRRTLALRPDAGDAHNNLGLLLKALKRLDAAEACYRRALALNSGKASTHGNLGRLLQELGRYGEAEASCRRALALAPESAEAHYHLGALLHYGLNRFEEAEASYRRALALKPECADARLSLGLLLLLRGQFEEGWRLCESRYHPGKTGEKVDLPRCAFPRWQGEPLAGKSLLILREQGLGDEIQFCRYAAVVKGMGAEQVSLLCRASLKALFSTLSEVDAVYAPAEEAAIPPHDYWAFALSLPLHCGTTEASIPARLPYLKTAPERMEYWAPRLPAAGKRVGLVWKGSATHKNDAHRSLPGLETLAPLWRVPGLNFVSLQKGEGEDQAAAPSPGQPLLNLGPELRDFADTAAVLSALDLLISVDTSVAHLAGALNRPCWVLLPHLMADWRWQLERSDSPWYPGALRLFRQPAEGGWATVAEAVAQALEQWSREPLEGEARPDGQAGSARLRRLAAKLSGLSQQDLSMIGAVVDRLAASSG
jgi:tetratricopeptide (TPR) repeat protein